MRPGPQPGVRSAVLAVNTLCNAWGDAAPDWLYWLAEECDTTSQAATARRIGYSGAYVSTLIHNKFKGDLNAIEQAVRGALRAETVDCPGLGQAIAGNQCIEWQKKAKRLRATSPLRVTMYRACRGVCEHSRLIARGNSVAMQQASAGAAQKHRSPLGSGLDAATPVAEQKGQTQ